MKLTENKGLYIVTEGNNSADFIEFEGNLKLIGVNIDGRNWGFGREDRILRTGRGRIKKDQELKAREFAKRAVDFVKR